MNSSKKTWINYVATQLNIKDTTFGHTLFCTPKLKKEEKVKFNSGLIKKNRKKKLYFKFGKDKKIISNLKLGSVLILLTKKLLGKKVVLIDITESGLFVVTGPFSVNGVSMRRVNPVYTLFSGAFINLEKLNTFLFNGGVKLLNDAYFETLKRSKSKTSKIGNYSYVLCHRIRQNYIDKYILDNLRKDFFTKAYLRTKTLLISNK